MRYMDRLRPLPPNPEDQDMSLTVIGSGVSPFVRKVLVTLSEKGLEFEHDPMVPFGVSDEYKLKHPLGKIPTLLDGDRVIPDSSAILVYLERIHPQPALYPEDPYDYARAVWYEELADNGLAAGTGAYFVERVLAKLFFNREGDEAVVEEAATNVLPPLFDYLERSLGDADWFVGNRFSIADIAVGSPFANYSYGDGAVDAARWPALAAFVQRVHSRPSFKELIEKDRAGIEAMRAG
jgi:glutathione S-transferase